MPVINSIKINDILYELAPTTKDALTNLTSALAEVGCTTEQMIMALRNISDLMAQMNWANTEIIDIKDTLHDLRYHCEGRDGNLSARIDLLEDKLDDLRPALDAKAENPNQKGDLEISNQIMPSLDFLKLEGNMFID